MKPQEEKKLNERREEKVYPLKFHKSQLILKKYILHFRKILSRGGYRTFQPLQKQFQGDMIYTNVALTPR